MPRQAVLTAGYLGSQPGLLTKPGRQIVPDVKNKCESYSGPSRKSRKLSGAPDLALNI